MQATLQVGFGDQDFQEMGISTGYAAWYAPMHSDQSSVELPARSGTPGNYTREAEGKNCSFFFPTIFLLLTMPYLRCLTPGEGSSQGHDTWAEGSVFADRTSKTSIRIYEYILYIYYMNILYEYFIWIYYMKMYIYYVLNGMKNKSMPQRHSS